MFYEIIYMHILVHIYVLYDMLNNIFAHLVRISNSTTSGYQLVMLVFLLVGQQMDLIYRLSIYIAQKPKGDEPLNLETCFLLLPRSRAAFFIELYKQIYMKLTNQKTQNWIFKL
jgi:hypothetical protein